MIARFLDWLLGPRCSCGIRVFPADQSFHHRHEHTQGDTA